MAKTSKAESTAALDSCSVENNRVHLDSKTNPGYHSGMAVTAYEKRSLHILPWNTALDIVAIYSPKRIGT
jgi:hypothetical protein